jgi:hypothetical protein
MMVSYKKPKEACCQELAWANIDKQFLFIVARDSKVKKSK